MYYVEAVSLKGIVVKQVPAQTLVEADWWFRTMACSTAATGWSWLRIHENGKDEPFFSCYLNGMDAKTLFTCHVASTRPI